MCIIAIKPQGAKFPPLEIIQNCIDNNADGFSMAWNKDGELFNFQTMSKDEIIKEYMKVSKLNPETTALIFHARIATHGSKKRENCHCWLNDDRTIAFAHNGMMHNIPPRDDMTDSETFFRDYFLPVLEGCGQATAIRMTNAIIGTNRIALMNNEGKVRYFGDFVRRKFKSDSEDILFSNNSFLYSPRSYYNFMVTPVSKRRTCHYPTKDDAKKETDTLPFDCKQEDGVLNFL